MTRTFTSPRSYHPSYSLLGRAFHAWTDDRLRGEALFIVALTGLALAFLMTHYLGWALLNPLFLASPMWETIFWVSQVASLLLLGGIGLVGVRPAVTVTCRPKALHLSQGSQKETVSYDTIEDIDTISAQQYYRHYRRYAATKVFVSQLPNEVLLLRTTHGPIVLALANLDAQTSLRTLLMEIQNGETEPFAASNS